MPNLQTPLLDDLRASLEQSPKPLIICGAGLAVAATNGAAPSWLQLLESGIAHALKFYPGEHTWAAYARSRLERNDSTKWVEVADELTKLLGGSGNAEFADWLEEQVGSLKISDLALLKAIGELECPIATTNYDGILEAGLSLPPITWDEHSQVHRILSGKRAGILHLHGYWSKPQSVILGSASYSELIGSHKATLLTEMMALERPIVFIGCSFDGLHDPDFTRIAQFVRAWQETAPRRYWLVRAGDDTPPVNHQERLYPVAFGTSYSDLPNFIERLVRFRAASPTIKSIQQHEPCPDLYGRSLELEDLIQSILDGKSSSIAGGPGFGKTALATASLYDSRIVSMFGDLRLFVSLETEIEPRAILARLAAAMGLNPAGDEPSLLRQLEIAAGRAPLIAILDNMEGILENDSAEGTRLIRLTEQIPNLQVIVTVRGTAPTLPGFFALHDLSTLDVRGAKAAFLSVAGHEFGDDPDLDWVLEVLDGHALSIQIIAAQAQGSSRLAGLRDAWEEIHAELLTRRDVVEGRLTSVRASLAISLNSRALSNAPFARRLLAVISLLPAGLGEEDVSHVLGERGRFSKSKALSAISVLQRLRLVERRLDRRLRILTPLRECARLDVPLLQADERRVIDRFLGYARLGKKVGRSGWNDVRDRLEKEADNLDEICGIAVGNRRIEGGLMGALLGLSDLARFTGLGSVTSIRRSAAKLEREGNIGYAAELVFKLAEITYRRGKAVDAEKLFRKSKSLAASAQNKMTEGNATCQLGDIYLSYSDRTKAIKYFSEGKQLALEAQDSLGEANAILGLASIKQWGKRPEEAENLLSEARTLYEAEGDKLGALNCDRMLGNIRGLTFADSQRLWEAYLDLGSIRSAASLMVDAAWELVKRGKEGDYFELFRRAQSLTVGVSDLTGEVRCMVRQGQALDRVGRSLESRELIREGFRIFFDSRPSDDLSLYGWSLMEKALLDGDNVSRKKNVRSALSEFAKIGRYDIMREWSVT